MEKITNSQIHTTPLPHRVVREEEVDLMSSSPNDRGLTPNLRTERQGGGSDESLISEVFQRRELLADLDRLIIADVRRLARRAWLRRWARAVVFSFGLPLALIIWVTCAYLYIKENDWTLQSFYVMLWPTLGLLFSTVYALRTFSPEEV